MFVEDKRSVAVRLLDGGQMLKFTSLKAETIFKEISTVISKWQNEKPVCLLSYTPQLQPYTTWSQTSSCMRMH